MQNEDLIQTRPQTFIDTAIYVRERQEGASRLARSAIGRDDQKRLSQCKGVICS